MKFGFYANLENLELAKDVGFDFVELPVSIVRGELPDIDFEEIAELVQNSKVSSEVWYNMLPEDIKVVGDEVDLYRVERYLRTAFERIGELGGEIVVFDSPVSRNIPSDFDTKEANEQLIKFLSLAGQIAGSNGITIGVMPVSADKVNNINSIDEAAKLVEEVGHPFVMLAVDLSELQSENGSVYDKIKDALEHLIYVRIGSNAVPAQVISKLIDIDYVERVSISHETADVEHLKNVVASAKEACGETN
jgi:sugar phosphate isomerase/epimerase